jgi:hypothetical protein
LPTSQKTIEVIHQYCIKKLCSYWNLFNMGGLVNIHNMGGLVNIHKTFESYEGWIERAKARGQFNTNIPTNMAVLYCDAQNGSAMRLQKEGIANGLIREILRTAFSALR